jgi:hypothetical protein
MTAELILKRADLAPVGRRQRHGRVRTEKRNDCVDQHFQERVLYCSCRTTSLVHSFLPGIIQLVLALNGLSPRLEALSQGNQALRNVVVL